MPRGFDWEAYIRSRAARYGVDPVAALAVASVEGLSGGRGDQGTSAGPFQLHRGGALPANRSYEWAESQEGIDYALSKIGQVAGGLKGKAAIAHIVRRFERPADPDGEIARAEAALGRFLTGSRGGAETLTRARPADLESPAPAVSLPGPSFADQRNAAVRTSGLQGLQSLVSGDFNPGEATSSLSESIAQIKPPTPTAQTSSPPKATRGAFSEFDPETGGKDPFALDDLDKWVVRAPTMDRDGVATKPEVLEYVARLARIFGSPLTIGTGSNHRQYVNNDPKGHQSDHWFGEAADIPATGDTLTRLGQDALIAAGADPKWARKQRGGVFNIGGANILFNTKVGGNHWNHLHVGLGRVLGRHL